MGIDCLADYLPSIQALCDKLNIPLYKMRWLGGKPHTDLINKI